MPYACDFEAAPLGSWADYEAKDPLARDPIRTRYALVSKGPDGITLEETYDRVNLSDFVFAFVFPPGKGPPEQLRRRVMQDGGFDPMEMPIASRAEWRLDPRSLAGSEEITVRAGSFNAKRYHYLTPFNESVDAWIDETAWPICLVKLDAEQKQMPDVAGRFSYELVATGSGAKPQITKPPVPYDIEVLKKRDQEKRARNHTPDSAPRVGDTLAP
jgi:hypothetical protein